MKKYKITLYNTENETYFEMELDDNQLKLVKEMCEKSKKVANYCNSLRMPVMGIEKVVDEESERLGRISCEDYICRYNKNGKCIAVEIKLYVDDCGNSVCMTQD
jgi:hypothetical protein